MGKRARIEPIARPGPQIVRRGWLHRSDGSALPARELLGATIQQHIGEHPDFGCHGGWAGVPVALYAAIEWEDDLPE